MLLEFFAESLIVHQRATLVEMPPLDDPLPPGEAPSADGLPADPSSLEGSYGGGGEPAQAALRRKLPASNALHTAPLAMRE